MIEESPVPGPFDESQSLGGEYALIEIIHRAVAAVLGRPSTDADSTFHDLGFDSMGLLELCNRLATCTGAALPVTVLFDYPTPAALARELLRLKAAQS
ncbi:acyl carrier protein [Nocardia sp. NPDC006044]|uniref:acyl carrier protein n=1 Tax=Nocardia sp. NPDC006044 TaxID=3364306 RepID=UPI0036B57423